LQEYISKMPTSEQKIFKLALSNTLLHASKLKSEKIRPLGVNNYWLPDDYIEENVWWRFIDRLNNVITAKNVILNRAKSEKISSTRDYKLYLDSALKLRNEDRSVDYIFTDPPYGEAIQYSELSFVWNCWLQEKFDTTEEVIINPIQMKDLKTFNEQMYRFVHEAYRVLKPDKFLTLCFQNKDIKIWADLAKLIRESGFELVDVSVFDTLGNPYNGNWAKFSPKSDFYITFRKIKKINKELESPIHVNDIFSEVTDNKEVTSADHRRVYNLFIASLIKHTFINQDVIGIKDLNLKMIAERLGKDVPYGNIQQRLL
jgi:hypothetical protein